MSTRLTYCVSTHNRPAFLRRLLAFFEQAGVDYPILVIDFSQPAAAIMNRAAIAALDSQLDMTYMHHDLPFVEKCREGLSFVQTRYVAFCADDDFQFMEVVDDCIDFLSDHADYTAAQGRVVEATNVLSRGKASTVAG